MFENATNLIMFNFRSLFLWVCLLCLLDTALLSNKQLNKSGAAHRCFCELDGQVDDCNCKVESVASFNNIKIAPRLQIILTRNFFKFFKVNLDKSCPFWSDDSVCALRSCAVCPCTDDQVPCGLKEEEGIAHGKGKYYSKTDEESSSDKSCDSRTNEEIRLSALDTTISEENEAAFRSWTEHDDISITFCELDDEQSVGMQYVDLTLNPERYTGYKGKSAWRIWNSIYNENCFKPEPVNAKGYKSLLSEKSVKGGMFGVETFGPSVDEFQKRFDPETTDGEGPIRLKNLYFTYLVVLRALAKAAPLLAQESFYTGENAEDTELKNEIKDILEVVKQFPNHFNESTMFQGDKLQAKRLKEEFRNHFLNISRIMDCVGCDKCKLWGKLQIQGLGTALKILFTSPDKLNLGRQEIISLFNGFGRLSSSIHKVQEFQVLLAEDTARKVNSPTKAPFL